MRVNSYMKTLLGASVMSVVSATAFATMPDNHAPIAVMGDHTHKSGEWMTSYRYGQMRMDGNRSGTSDVSVSDVHANFMVAPTEMTMEMHMFGLMYGWSDNFTIMGMLPYVEKEMEHRTRMGMNFTTETKGLGDAKISGLYTIHDSTGREGNPRVGDKAHLNFGLSFPTGAIDERDDTPAMANAKLPYPMQLGSGTYDPMFGATYVSYKEQWSWGAQATAVLRLAENDENYRLGNEYKASAWVAHNIGDFLSGSFRLEGLWWGDIHGADADLNPMMVPTARTDLRGGERIDLLVGVNLLKPDGFAEGHRLAAEFGVPIYENLSGPQMSTDYRFTLGWQYAF
ncbi:MAG: transporter [Rickettsiales bacterium]|nr:transporter [Rickettsiales bacterium]